jgi:tetratricopeptide (TPR) repeat protein
MRKAFMETLEGSYRNAGSDLDAGFAVIEGMEEGPLRESMLALYHTRRGDLVSLVRPDLTAEEDYRKALSIYRRHEDRLGEATVLNNMSEIYNRSGDYITEVEVLKQVEEINRRNDDALGMAIAAYNLAEAHAAIGRHSLARDNYQRYIDLSGRIENRLGLAYGRLGLGRLETAQGRYGMASEYLQEAVELFEELGSPVLELEAGLALSLALLGDGRLQEAAAQVKELEGADLRADHRGTMSYIRGLLHLEEYRADTGRTELLEMATGELRDSLEIEVSGGQIPELARRWLSLMEAEELIGGDERAEAAREEARSSLIELLERVPSRESREVLEGIPEVERILG